MKNFFLHCGTHKTGTTSIQSFCKSNIECLERKKLIYPTLRLINKKQKRSHLNVFDVLSENSLVADDLDYQDSVDFIKKVVHDYSNSDVDIFLSAENIFRFSYELQRKLILLLKNLIDGVFELCIILSLRDQFTYSESLYRNHFRAYKNKPLDFEKWLITKYNVLDYEKAIKNLTLDFSLNLILMPYENKSTYLNDFFNLINIDIAGCDIPKEKKNPSLSLIDCEVKNLLNKLDCSKDIMEQYNHFAFNNPTKNEGRNFHTITTLEYIEENFISSNNRLIEKYPHLSIVLNLENKRLLVATEANDLLIKNRLYDYIISMK